jgi:uncharacterized radical SAM superfamily Fe-S cluster-containing enzyme
MTPQAARPYRLVSCTTSLCPLCRQRVEAKIVEQDGSIHLLKYCPTHGQQMDLLEKRADYYLARARFDKPSTPSKTQTAVNRGCPFDCGLCPVHEQHTCIGLIEITQRCSLGCAACYSRGTPLPDLTVEQAGRMMDFYLEAEGGAAEVLQISGGEPAEHPRVLDILRLAKSKGFRYVMLNTNGLRVAEDEVFANQLAALSPGFELYLQFDGFEPAASVQLRGRDLTATKAAALKRLEALSVPTTLVMMVRRGVNDGEIGAVLEGGMRSPCVRGVNLQPLADFAGREPAEGSRPITLSEVLEMVEAQMRGTIRAGDFVPLPCNVERVALTYLFRGPRGFEPITRHVDFAKHLGLLPNTFAFDADEFLRQAKGAGALCDCTRRLLDDLRPLIPARYALASDAVKVRHFNTNVFRVSVTSFLDPFNFELKAMQKECVHVITPDLRRIPFSAYNMFHRGL